MLVLDGKAVAQHVQDQLRARVQDFRTRHGRAPHLAVVLVGEDPASQVYVRNKHKACEKIGMISTIHSLNASSTPAELDRMVQSLNQDPDVDGVLVQLPLPAGLKPERVLEILDPSKDVDGLTYVSMGFVWAGRPGVKPCTPHGVMKILDYYKIPVAGKRAVVIGRSNIVGKPMAHLLTEANATVTLCHTKTVDLASYTRAADLVVVAAGAPRRFGRDDFKAGAVVVDVGIHRLSDGKICGDVRYEELESHAAAATPVPGGVGPMTIACLLENTMWLAEKRATGRVP